MINNLFNNIEKGIENRIISFNENKTRITYLVKKPFTTNFQNPEEPVRAACFCDLVLNYKYPVERIQFEISIKPDKDRIDLLVYNDDEFKEPYIVVECKKSGINEVEFNNAIEQVFRYANYKKAWYAMAVTGNTSVSFNVKDFKSGERNTNVIGDIPIRYGKPPKYKYYKKKGKDLKIGSCEELINVLEKCHDTVWQGGKLAPTTAFDEVSKLLFCKLKDEKVTTKNQAYQFQIGTYETPQEVFTRIDTIYQKAKKESKEVFKEDIRLSSEIVFSCLKHLQQLAISKIDLDAKGIAFEKFMQDFFKGKMGQFFTPRNIVQFAVEMIQPNNEMYVLDPACGSGGFLLNAMAYVRAYAEQNYIDKLEIYKHWHDFAKDRLLGIEINDQIARVCKMNMILQDDGHSNIISCDSLDYIERIRSINKRFRKNHFDLILTNPPFGAKVKYSEKDYLKNYKLGNNKNKIRKTQKMEILFIERCIEFLKPETGKMAIILPDSILNNPSLQYVRDYILETCQILAIVSLPQTAFLHYGAGVKSSLLFVRKKKKDENLGNLAIFMAIAEHIGYDATGRETPDKNDLPEILTQYKQFEQTQNFDKPNNIFLVNCYEMDGNLDPSYYKPEFINNFYKIKILASKQLGELISFSKETWNPKQQNSFTNTFPYIEIGGIDVKTGDIKHISEIKILEAPRNAKRIVRENDIILSTTRPSRGAIGLIDKHSDGFIASNGFAVLRQIQVESLDRKYLFYALRLDSTLKQFEQRSSGGIYPIITKDELKKVLIPLPSKEIQSQIITLMDQAYRLKKKKENDAERLLGSIDNHMLAKLNISFPEIKEEKIFTIYAEEIHNNRSDVYYHQPLLKEMLNCIKRGKYPVLEFKNFIRHIQYGASVKNNYVDDGIPLLRILNIKHNKCDRDRVVRVPFSTKKDLGNAFVKEGDILVSSCGSVGRTAVVSKESDGFAFSSSLIKIEVENINKNYLCFWLNNPLFQKIIQREQIGAIQKNITIPIIKNFWIPNPPMEIQNKITQEVQSRLERVQSLKQQAVQNLQKAKQEVEDILFKT